MRQGGAKPGHEGHGRKEVAAEDADETKVADAQARDPALQDLQSWMRARRPGEIPWGLASRACRLHRL